MVAHVPFCQYCKTPLLWLNEANQWYCPRCRIYPFIQRKDELTAAFDNILSSHTYYCPHCGQASLVWYPQYQKWYCFVCRNYK